MKKKGKKMGLIRMDLLADGCRMSGGSNHYDWHGVL